MSLQHLMTDKHVFNGYPDMNFLPPPPPPAPHLSLSHAIGVMGQPREARNPQMGFQILRHSMGQDTKPRRIQQFERRGAKRPGDMSDGDFGVQKKSLFLNLGEEEELKTSSLGRNGHIKLCARGHWRPAEDAKLKELVAQYGPQNWNLIAENLEGRSGKPPTKSVVKKCKRRLFEPKMSSKMLTLCTDHRIKLLGSPLIFPFRKTKSVSKISALYSGFQVRAAD